MPNFDHDANRSDERSSSAGAVLGINFALSEKVLMAFISLLLTFLSGMAYGRIPRPDEAVDVVSQTSSQCEVPIEQETLP
ncbi:hypothetical protein [Leptothoe sp. PORK10 BA2]|uniref:hypothetical protein n=1 Tax=Leptothoe sp. PORK10 BA2 TaxID=3110254 RepID=UPI002B20089F|nr:hypothetical protein [Leptothoe sp. PORK10 BA2]MEA5464500.1 hypothetical protein [Leptothoe sp. PORK10 BA2]